MESKDQVKKGTKDRASRTSENEKTKANLKTEAIGRDAKSGKEKTSGNARQVRETQRVTEKNYSFGTEKQSIPEAGSPRVKMSKPQNREDSNGNFLSSIKFNKKTLLGIAGALAGGALLFRATKKGKSSSTDNEIKLQTKQTIKRSPEELYAYWRNLENLPNFMSHIKEVREMDETRSSWTAEVPGGMGEIEWDAVIEQDITNKFISWRSVADSDIENAGEVRFEAAPGGKGTIVETTISYHPPAGNAGEYVAKLLNPAFEKIVKKDLKQFKKHMEKGGDARERKQSGKIIY